jgi:hypothetical protein
MQSRKQIILESVMKHARAAINGINLTIADDIKELDKTSPSFSDEHYPEYRFRPDRIEEIETENHANMIHSIFGIKTPGTYTQSNRDIFQKRKWVPTQGPKYKSGSPFMPVEPLPNVVKTRTGSTIFHSLHRLRSGLQQKLEQLKKKAPDGGSEEHQWKINKHAAALVDTHKIMDTLAKGEWGGIPGMGTHDERNISLYGSQLRAARSGIEDVVRNLRAKREQNYAPEVMFARKERLKLT